jgi:hypothetical protein
MCWYVSFHGKHDKAAYSQIIFQVHAAYLMKYQYFKAQPLTKTSV